MPAPPVSSLTVARSRLRRASVRVFVAQSGLYLLAAALVAAAVAGAALLWSPLAWGLAVLLGFGLGAALNTSWVAASLLFALHPRCGVRQGMLRGWLGAVLLLAVAAAFAPWWPWWAAMGAGAFALAMTPLLSVTTRRLDQNKLSAEGLPPEAAQALQALPKRLHPRVEQIVDASFRDWSHLHELLQFASDSALRAYVDVRAMHADANATLTHVLRRAPLVNKLCQLAQERGDQTSIQVADRGMARLVRVSDALHDAVAAASQYAASERPDEGHALKARVEGLRLLADTLDVDLEEIEADSWQARLPGSERERA